MNYVCRVAMACAALVVTASPIYCADRVDYGLYRCPPRMETINVIYCWGVMGRSMLLCGKPTMSRLEVERFLEENSELNFADHNHWCLREIKK